MPTVDLGAGTGRGVSLRYHIGDTLDLVRQLPDDSVDLIVTSPPFLALRSYLPADHPDKHREIGSEATPADFLDTLLGLTGEWLRVLAPHGSICVELGDTYASGGNGTRPVKASPDKASHRDMGDGVVALGGGPGWPLAKSLTGIPTLYTWSLAYGRNLLNGNPAPQLRVRNVIVWARPNPPVGALGDKFRPATSYITVACKGPKRYFDLDAVRTPGSPNTHARLAAGADPRPESGKKADNPNNNFGSMSVIETAGAPPLDWHADDHPEDGDWLWKMSTQPYRGSHYATFPLTLPKRLIEAMCPLKVCTVCGKPSERVVDARRINEADDTGRDEQSNVARLGQKHAPERGWEYDRTTTGWTDCGHDSFRTGVVLDPFAGSGTTIEAAQAVGRHAIGFDLDDRNADLARQRVGMFLEVAS
jgi:site-specific DNA-methyltransferase (adenine-specific)